MGTTVMATTRDAIRAKEIVRAKGSINCLTSPVVNTMGKNTQMVVNVDARIAPATCFAP